MKIRAVVALITLCLICFSAVTHAADEVYISVSNGVLTVFGQEIQLSDDSTPIQVTTDQAGGVILLVRTPDGVKEVFLGQVTLSMSPGTVQYVKVVDSTTSNTQKQGGGAGVSATKRAWDYETCPYCGRDNHGGTHTCPSCGQFFCKHDDVKCYYMVNPRPTPYKTTTPDGTTVYGGVSDDGTFIAGSPDGKAEKLFTIDYSMFFSPKPTETPTPWPIP